MGPFGSSQHSKIFADVPIYTILQYRHFLMKITDLFGANSLDNALSFKASLLVEIEHISFMVQL